MINLFDIETKDVRGMIKNFIMLESSSFLKTGRGLTAERSKSQVRELIII